MLPMTFFHQSLRFIKTFRFYNYIDANNLLIRWFRDPKSKNFELFSRSMGAAGPRTRRSLGHHPLHPQILRPRALFYRANCTCSSKFLNHALARGTSILGEVRHVEILGFTQQLLSSKFHVFLALLL